MADRVKPKRPYESPRRREQAAATRLEILDAAQRLFERDGYPATTMAAIATDARVALKTVYVAFETKSGVLQALWNARLRGDAKDVPIAQNPWYLEVLDEPDPERQLRLNARNSRAGKLRIAALAEVIRSAAPLDPDIDALWTRINTEYHSNQRAIVESLNDKQALTPNLDVASATDILWTINHPNTWQLLVTQQGWTPERYERWAAETAVSQLLQSSPADHAPTPEQVSPAAKKANLSFASLGYGRRVGWRAPSRPDRGSTNRLICRPALAEIVGEGRPWTVLMISLLSMPCR